MSLAAANRFIENWVDPGGELTEFNKFTQTGKYVRLWRGFRADGVARMSLRVDVLPLI